MDDDLLQMVQMHFDGDNPTDYLSMKLDNLLIELEKQNFIISLVAEHLIFQQELLFLLNFLMKNL